MRPLLATPISFFPGQMAVDAPSLYVGMETLHVIQVNDYPGGR
jgi:hypothetical protein